MVPSPILVCIGGFFLQIAGESLLCIAVIMAAVVAIILTTLAFEGYIGGKKAFIALAALSALYILLTFSLFKDGMAATFNDIVSSYREIKPYNYITLYVGTKHIKAAKTIFMCWMSFVLGGFLTLSLRRHSKVPLAVVTIMWLVSLAVFHEILSPLWVIMSAFALAIWAFHQKAYEGMQRFEAVLSGDWAILLRVLVIGLVVVLIFNVAMPQDSYLKPALLTEAQSLAQNALDNGRYGSEKSGLTGGKVYKAGELQRSEDTMLEVTMENPDSYYLRGFVGEVYDNSQWKELDGRKLSDSVSLFYWLHQDGFYGLSQLFNGAKIEKDDVESSSMTIKNIGASRKYVYAPYELSASSNLLDENLPGDTRLESKGLRGDSDYTLDVVENQVKRYQNLSAALIKAESEGTAQSYIKDESYYNRYVYENYTEVPAEISSLLSEYLGQYVVASGESHFDYQMAKQNIMFFMTNKMEYSEKTTETGKDIDFILNFLEGTKQGYDIHFASAATMMFRYYGIPARYVEGYLITKDDVKGAEAGESLSLDGTHAHAWVEYYHDGIGWLPFEVTPTYLDVMENPDTMKNISSLLGQYEGEDKNLEEESEQEPQTEDGIQSFLIKYKMLIIFFTLAAFVGALIALFIWWLARERRKAAARIASFDDEDVSKGICNIFDYTIDLLLAWGLEPRKGLLMELLAEINRLMEKEMDHIYKEVLELRQEAKYSLHMMSEDDRQIVRNFEESIKQKMWQEANAFQKLKYKYMYFL